MIRYCSYCPLPLAAAYRSLKIAQLSLVQFILPQQCESSCTFISELQPSMAIFIFLPALFFSFFFSLIDVLMFDMEDGAKMEGKLRLEG